MSLRKLVLKRKNGMLEEEIFMSNRSYRRCKLCNFKACLDPSHMRGLVDVDKVELVIDPGRIRLVLNERR